MEKAVSGSTYVNGTGKVHFKNILKYSDANINYEFNKFFYGEIIKLLLNVYEEKLILSDLKVSRLYAHTYSGYANLRSSESKTGLLNASIEEVTCEFEYKGIFYLSHFRIIVDRSRETHYNIDFSFLKDCIANKLIGHELLRYALHYTSDFRKGCVEISFNPIDREAISYLDIKFINPPKSDIKSIFIDSEIKSDIDRFIYTFKNFDKHKVPLRYLLSGKPGLGKTEVIRSVISECSEYGSIIIPKNMNGADWLVFEFARMLRPALVCIDDIDLVLGTRDEGYTKKSLNSFLQMLDGILNNKFFLIATTNDKDLVDLAASRPGRFDEIIDFGKFERKYYSDLINKMTKNERILSLFTKEVYDILEGKEVTGAYLVNLIKQLTIMTEINEKLEYEDLIKYIDRNHKGFYKKYVDNSIKVGF